MQKRCLFLALGPQPAMLSAPGGAQETVCGAEIRTRVSHVQAKSSPCHPRALAPSMESLGFTTPAARKLTGISPLKEKRTKHYNHHFTGENEI